MKKTGRKKIFVCVKQDSWLYSRKTVEVKVWSFSNSYWYSTPQTQRISLVILKFVECKDCWSDFIRYRKGSNHSRLSYCILFPVFFFFFFFNNILTNCVCTATLFFLSTAQVIAALPLWSCIIFSPFMGCHPLPPSSLISLFPPCMSILCSILPLVLHGIM